MCGYTSTVFKSIRVLFSLKDCSRVEFRVGDGCNLPALSAGPLGCILTTNTLCRVPDPAKFLEQARDLLVPGGLLVMAESYTWTEETTPKVG